MNINGNPVGVWSGSLRPAVALGLVFTEILTLMPQTFHARRLHSTTCCPFLFSEVMETWGGVSAVV